MDILKKSAVSFLIISLLNILSLSRTEAIYLKKPIQNINNNKFIGTWKMQTIVTESKCPYIFTGSTTESNLVIKPSIKKKLNSFLYRAFWNGGSWANSTGTLKFLSDKEAVTERLTQMKSKDSNSWKAILVDHLYLKEGGVIHSESIVTQYKNDIPVGEYKTFSILTKAE